GSCPGTRFHGGGAAAAGPGMGTEAGAEPRGTAWPPGPVPLPATGSGIWAVGLSPMPGPAGGVRGIPTAGVPGPGVGRGDVGVWAGNPPVEEALPRAGRPSGGVGADGLDAAFDASASATTGPSGSSGMRVVSFTRWGLSW